MKIYSCICNRGGDLHLVNSVVSEYQVCSEDIGACTVGAIAVIRCENCLVAIWGYS